MQQSATLGMQTWINEAGPPFSLVVVCLSTQVAEPAGENHYPSPVHSWSMVTPPSVEDKKAPGSVWVTVGRWMRG